MFGILGGGATAAGGLGMADGTMAIVSSGVILGAGIRSRWSSWTYGKENNDFIVCKADDFCKGNLLKWWKGWRIFQYYIWTVCKKYCKHQKRPCRTETEGGCGIKGRKETVKGQINNMEEFVHVMKSMNKHNSAFVVGMEAK